MLFLLDEILHGTNSHDRRIGAAAVVKGLVERGALGLVTTPAAFQDILELDCCNSNITHPALPMHTPHPADRFLAIRSV